MRVAAALAFVLISIAADASLARAQESRADAIAQEQEKKAAALKPYQPGGVERALTRVERIFVQTPSGFYPFFGSIYTGGGFAVGPGYRAYYGDRTFWDLKGAISIRAYKLIEWNTVSPGHAKGRIDLFANAGWREATQVPFYGLGNQSVKDGRTDFELKNGYATAGLTARPTRWTVTGATVSVEDFRTADGHGRRPSTLAVHTPQTAPGLGATPTYVHTLASAAIDWRPSPGYARRGGLYELSYHNYADRDQSHSFDRLDAQLVQHIPILRENWVLSVRTQVQTTLGDDVVPYFLLPALGSGSTLRGYASWRFRDRHSLLGSAEWRWIPNRLGLDMALFADAGKVAGRRGDLDLEGLKSDVGIGARFHGPAATMLRIELARGGEGTRLILTGGAAF